MADSTNRPRVIPAREPDDVSVGGIFRRYGEAWLRGKSLSWRRMNAFFSLRACRTEAMGVRRDVCEQCGTVRLSYCSCGDRHCPQCQFPARERWLRAREAELLPVPYFHGVFTLPHEYNALVPDNEALIYDLVFHTAADVLLAHGRKQFRGQIGMLALLHTWTQRLKRHVHVHIIIPAGALTEQGQWRPARNSKWLFDVKEMMSDYRRSLSRRLKLARTRGALRLPPELAHLDSKREFSRFVDGVAAKKWEVYLKPPFAGPEKVLKYVANYTHRVAIGNGRIRSVRDGIVTFTWRDRNEGGKIKTEELPAGEFIDRFMMHVLPRQYVKVRYFGFYAPRGRAARLEQIRQALHAQVPAEPDPPPSYAALWQRATGEDLSVCPVCGGRMRLGKTAPSRGWLSLRAPPETIHVPHAA